MENETMKLRKELWKCIEILNDAYVRGSIKMVTQNEMRAILKRLREVGMRYTVVCFEKHYTLVS
jgi:hypothetical protein